MRAKNILYLGIDPSRYLHSGILHHLPLIRTIPRPFQGEIKMQFENSGRYTHVLFTSRTTIPLYLDFASKAGFSLSMLQEKIYLSIGQSTTQRLEEAGLTATYTTCVETGEGIVSLLESIPLSQAHLFFPRSAQGRSVITHYLEKREMPFTLVDLYDTEPNPVILPDLEQFDEIVFTSPSTVHAFYAQTKKLPPLEKCVALGPITASTLKEYSITVP
ncbi:MAG TPA: uroporphyrinogen-III synthase [Waddliaceae bacterium]